jgi:parvulin-like peptidyl-prolyl isomerase
MLESMRRNSRNIVIYVIFGILIAVFIISFGPQSGARLSGMKGQSGGCGADSTPVASVKGNDVGDSSWRFVVNGLYNGGSANGKMAREAQIRERVMDALLVRELLAGEAEEAGFHVSDDEVADRVSHGELLIAGTPIPKAYYFEPPTEEEKAKNPDAKPKFTGRGLDAFAKRVGLASAGQILEEERREMLAQKMRSLVLTSVRVSPEEAKQAYEQQNTSASIDYVRFDPDKFADALEPSAADVAAYAGAHDDDLKKQFELEKSRYENREKEVKLRVLLVKKTEAPASAPASQPAAASQPAKPDPKKQIIDAAAARIKAGGDFGAEARKLSEAGSAKKGGEMGWVNAEHPGLGEEVKQAIDKLTEGQISDVVEVPGVGWYLVKLEGKREGTLTYDQVKLELAEEQLRQDRGKAEAKAAADKAYAAAKAGTPLDKQFKKAEEGAPDEDTDDILVKTQPGVGRSSGYIAGIGPAPELVKELYGTMAEGDLASKVYEIAGKLYVVKLDKRELPDMDKFEKEKDTLAGTLESTKAKSVLDAFEAQKCSAARKQIKVNRDFVEYSETDDKTGKSTRTMTYVPCMTLLGAEVQPQVGTTLAD